MKNENIFTESLVEVRNYMNSLKTECDNGISSGFRTLDRHIGGLKGGTLNVIASRPSVGKTSLAVSMAVNIVFGENPFSVGFFSFEHSGRSVVEQIVAGKGHFDLVGIRKGILNPEERESFNEIYNHLYSTRYGFILSDDPGLGLYDLCSRIRNVVRSYGVNLVFIDGTNLIRNELHLPNSDWISEISRELKLLAREMDIPVVCSCHVNRKGGRERAPMLSDLRDSGLIEHYADLVLLIDNPAVRLLISSFPGTDDETDLQSDLNTRKIIVAKNRNGSTGAFSLKFNPSTCSFLEMNED